MIKMLEWAKREVEIAKNKERENVPENKWKHKQDRYDDAFKTFQSLCEYTASNNYEVSIIICNDCHILDQLIDGKPLTPIEDEKDIWYLPEVNQKDKYAEYQCKRMSSLYKRIYSNGVVEYIDRNQCYGQDVITGNKYNNSLIRDIISELYPITMPYSPEDIIEVAVEKFLNYEKNKEITVLAVYYATVKGKRVEINRFFVNSDDFLEVYPGWYEITKEEFEIRKKERKH